MSKLERIRDDVTYRNPSLPGATSSKRERYGWPDLGQRGVYMEIEVTDLHIDRTYQRQLRSRKRVVDIARDLDWLLFGVLIVVMRSDGTMVIVDGQHRGIAVSLRDDRGPVPCLVFEYDDLGAEARAFIDANTTTQNASPYERHKAGVVGGHDTALVAERIMRKHGYSFSPESGTRHTTNAVSTVHRMVKRDHGLADRVIGLCVDIAHGEPLKAPIMEAIGWIGERDGAVFDGIHRERLVEYGPDVLEAEIKRYRMIVEKGGPKVYAQAVLKLLNKGRRSNKVCPDELP